MPRTEPNDLRPPIQYKPRRAARQLSEAEIKAAADRAEARSVLAANRLADDPRLTASKLAPTRVIEG
jgi:hypothetical protein